MVDAAQRAQGAAPRVAHWVFEPFPGQISGCDDEGRVLVAIAAGPWFGARLAAAFDSLTALAVAPVPVHAAVAR